VHKWRFEASGQFSSKSAYEALFHGAIHFKPSKLIWSTWAPRKCKFFLWLVAHNRCWKADRLARRGLPHPERCPFCDQEDETIQHLLRACVSSRQFWQQLLRCFDLLDLAPQTILAGFFEWWQQAGETLNKEAHRGFHSLVVLGAWILWKMRNDIVFNGASPRIDQALLLAQDEADLGCMQAPKA
jgi:hypothetical protein